MAFTDFSEFFTMGRHGTFVWSAYAIVLLSLVTIHVLSRLRHRRLTRKLHALKCRNEPR